MLEVWSPDHIFEYPEKKFNDMIFKKIKSGKLITPFDKKEMLLTLNFLDDFHSNKNFNEFNELKILKWLQNTFILNNYIDILISLLKYKEFDIVTINLNFDYKLWKIVREYYGNQNIYVIMETAYLTKSIPKFLSITDVSKFGYSNFINDKNFIKLSQVRYQAQRSKEIARKFIISLMIYIKRFS